jgi:hypothetical protein
MMNLDDAATNPTDDGASTANGTIRSCLESKDLSCRGTGFLGRALVTRLKTEGHLTRIAGRLLGDNAQSAHPPD